MASVDAKLEAVLDLLDISVEELNARLAALEAREAKVIVGPTGDKGADGKDGRDGSDGRDGKDGKDGRNGRDGKDGKDGRDGKDLTDGLTEDDVIKIVKKKVNPEYVGGYPHDTLTESNVYGKIDIVRLQNEAGQGGIFIQPDQPVTNNNDYIWIQTGLGANGDDYTIWFQDC